MLNPKFFCWDLRDRSCGNFGLFFYGVAAFTASIVSKVAKTLGNRPVNSKPLFLHEIDMRPQPCA